MAQQKFDAHQHITDQIIAAIEAGTPPWRKPWTGTGGAAFPLRSTGEPYRGINVLLLWLEASEKSYASAHWFTYRQAGELGGQVRRGEKSSIVTYFNTVDREDDDGGTRKVPFLRTYRVFNADQIDGLPESFHRAPDPARDLGTEPDPELDAFFAAIGARIETTDRPRAFYAPATDHIHMPPIATFHDANGYYATLAHEHVHYSGHKSRLDRLATFQDRAGLAIEEITAEIGAAMICARIGLVPEIAQSAAYVESWLAALREDKRAIFRAASEAQKAADYLLERAYRDKAAA